MPISRVGLIVLIAMRTNRRCKIKKVEVKATMVNDEGKSLGNIWGEARFDGDALVSVSCNCTSYRKEDSKRILRAVCDMAYNEMKKS